MTRQEKDAFRKACEKQGSTEWLQYTESYVVHSKYVVNGYWNDGEEMFFASTKGAHGLVEQRWKEIHAKELQQHEIRLIKVVYQ